jgi:predicted nucleic acid-binding protein
MLRVVIDTNVLVSALLKPDSVPELILPLILERR